ncbi:MAG: DUF1893 domain-containing protein [Bacteroidaceae bacterium]|nr:DUF1893 domain-containing protein [Bacteroidaceae bacterium]
MQSLIARLAEPTVRGILRTTTGEERVFPHRGVRDLYELLTTEPQALRGAQLADRVIGRGAALLLVRGGVREVYAHVMSQGALAVLRDAGIQTSYASLQPYIINRAGTGMCPVEQLTQNTTSPDEAYQCIGRFLCEMSNK